MNYYNKLFNDEFEDSQQLDENVINIINKYGIDIAIKYLEELNPTWINIENYQILCAINCYTRNDIKEEEKHKILNHLLSKASIKKIKERPNKKYGVEELYIEQKDNTSYSVIKLTDLNKEILNVLPDLEDDRRTSTCYRKAYELAFYLKEESEVVTGYCYGQCNLARFLHSWIEVKNNNTIYVIDGTLNCVIKKDEYYKLRHVEVINRLKSSTIKKDFEKYISKLDYVYLAVYFVFRDELIKDFRKNKKIFKEKKLCKTIIYP